MSVVDVQKISEGKKESLFSVTVIDLKGSSEHLVAMNNDFYESYGISREIKSEAIIEESYKFLLEREPKEAIMNQFNLSLIEKYFPQYRDEIKKRLSI